MEKKFVYLDHAAATPLEPRVLKAMTPYFKESFGNPSALYKAGITAEKALSAARSSVARNLGTQPDTIIFTSGGTESNNLALLGLARANARRGNHVVSIGIEHPAILEPLEQLRAEGFQVTFIPVSPEGIVDPAMVIAAFRHDTLLVTIMYANNEIGSVQPIAAIGREILKYRQQNNTAFPYFHTDACQAPNYLDLSVEKLHVDAMTLNGSKIYGPKGSGCLYLRRGIKIEPLLRGGGQEQGLRSGTENVPAIVGFAEALALADSLRVKESSRVVLLRQYFWDELKKALPSVLLNGPEFGEERLPNNLHILFARLESEQLLLYLDEAGIACSAASACASQSREASHVLTAIGMSDQAARQCIRFSLGRKTTKADIDYTIVQLVKIYRKIAQF